MENITQFLQEKLSAENFDKLIALANPKLHAFIADAIELANPDSVFVATDSDEDLAYIRNLAIETKAEKKLAIEGHTYHYDGYNDQARDPARTKYLLPKGVTLGASLNSMDKEEGVAEVRGFLKDSMVGKEMLVCFFCLGPTESEFSISCAQITDSAYVAHSECILYRPGYDQFNRLGASEDFFRFLHTEGETENGCSKNIDKRRIYMDLEEERVYSTNTQYAGNTVGLKKLALRLGIQKAGREGWLAEHMFVMGVNGPNGRKTYFTGAFPSACGKTSTAMLPGQKIIGDDIAYLRKIDGTVKCVNVERGIFGIIKDVNPSDDPEIYAALTTEGEVIFSNILVTPEGKPMWLGMGEEPTAGVNHSGDWTPGKVDANGNEVTCSHKNARYTIGIQTLVNRDENANNPAGVEVGAMVYGGRDSDTLVPVEQAFNWTEGIISKGASIESETTAATLGQEGVRKFNIMANQDFVSIPLGQYIQNNLDFANGLEKTPDIYSVNYFLRGEDGKFLNGISDKKVWILWAELRTNGDVEAIKTPTGFIPVYEDVARLFKENLDIDYTKADYEKAFTIRIPNMLAKIDRVEAIYKDKVEDTPQLVWDTFNAQRDRLKAAQAEFGDNISPFTLQAAK